MPDRATVIVGIVIGIVIAILMVSWIIEAGNCLVEQKGEMVQGLSWNGYVCVEGVNND
jgi:hypothetical protein